MYATLACVFAAMIGLAGLPSLAIAQMPNSVKPATADVGAPSADDIKLRINLLKSRNDVTDDERGLILDQLNAALARTQSAEAAAKASQEYADELQSAPDRISTLTAQAESAAEEVAEPQYASGDLVRNQLHLAALQARDVKLRSDLRKLDEVLQTMATRPAQARDELVSLRAELNSVRSVTTSSASPTLVEASRLREDAARRDLSARIDKTEQELLTLPARESIATAQRDIATQELRKVDAASQLLAEKITAQRRLAAQQRVDDAETAAAELAAQPKGLGDYAAATTQMRQSELQLSQQLDADRGKREQLRNELARITAARTNSDEILAIGRVDDRYGRTLRTIESSLPSAAKLERRVAKRTEQVTDVRIQRLQAQQDLRALDNSDTAASSLLTDAGLPTTPDLAATARTLVESRRAALADYIDLLGQRVERFGDASVIDAELRQQTSQLRSLLNERLLWLPSATAISAAWLTQEVGPNLHWLFSPDNIGKLPMTLWEQLRQHWIAVPLLVLLIVALLATRKRLIASLEALAKPVGHRGDSFTVTLLAAVVSLLIALPPPLIIGTLGAMLISAISQVSYIRAIGAGLINAAIVLFMLGVFQAMCRHFGLFVVHFGWDEQGTRRLGRALHLLALALAPAAFLKGMADSVGSVELVEGIGRLGFMIGSLGLAVFMYRVFRPHDGALTGDLDRDKFIWRTRHIWFWVLVAVPLALAVLSAIGYFATASQLQARLFTTGWIFLLIVIGYRTAMRGVIVTGRRTAYEQAEARHLKAKQQSDNANDESMASEGPIESAEEADIDVVEVSRQTRTLLRAASALLLALLLWGVWKSMFAALNVFDQVVLWSHVVTTPTGDSVSAVTLFDVLRSLLAVVLTFVAARNLPGFLEIVVLQRLHIDAGTRYAISTIGRYLILAIGLVTAFNWIGADWSELQWIIAALGVGLGFGLQEIVANFVSGIIILFERPVRVGDLVSIGTNTGTVTRIQIRAITITDFDNFEVLVPNKAFITSPVQNWSLTSPMTRLLLKVGVAYGTDIAQARALILGAAQSHPNVLKTPAASAMFVNFGESSLDFELRAYVGKIDHRLGTTNDLLTAIDTALKSAGIEIPFPQRDLHLRSGVPGAKTNEQPDQPKA
ncbi:MAG: mechanosensitive ion channel domain-containing protein [Dokdonella sp.]